MSKQIHEYADLIPQMSDSDYSELKNDIQTNGLLQPITLFEEKILDGRHRYKACIELSVEPKFIEYTGNDAYSFVISANVKRRHLNTSQRAMIGVELEKHYAKEITKQESNRKTLINRKNRKLTMVNLPQSNSRTQAAKIVNVSGKTIQTAKLIMSKATKEQIKDINDGKTTLNKVKQQINRIQRHETNKNVQLPVGEFNVIYADPPWEYDFQIESRDIENQYDLMSIEKIKSIRVPTAKNSVLYLWVSAPKLEQAFDILKAWGFVYKSCIIWDKQIIGCGYWSRGQHEILLIATKGHVSPPDPNVRESSIYSERRGKHSKKPDHYYKMIEKQFPEGKYLELFARKKYNEKWTVWGNEV